MIATSINNLISGTRVDGPDHHPWQSIEERLGTTPDSTAPECQRVWGLRYIDDLVLRDRDTTGAGTLDERLYACQDANWNMLAMFDTSAAVQERYFYSPFGWPTFMDGSFTTIAGSAIDSEILFTGQRFDSKTGLHLFRMRFLESLTGRFIHRDPLGYPDGPNAYSAWFVPSLVDPSGEGGTVTLPVGPRTGGAGFVNDVNPISRRSTPARTLDRIGRSPVDDFNDHISLSRGRWKGTPAFVDPSKTASDRQREQQHQEECKEEARRKRRARVERGPDPDRRSRCRIEIAPPSGYEPHDNFVRRVLKTDQGIRVSAPPYTASNTCDYDGGVAGVLLEFKTGHVWLRYYDSSNPIPWQRVRHDKLDEQLSRCHRVANECGFEYWVEVDNPDGYFGFAKNFPPPAYCDRLSEIDFNVDGKVIGRNDMGFD